MLHQIEETLLPGGSRCCYCSAQWIIKVKKPQVTAGTPGVAGLREKGTAASAFLPQRGSGFLQSLLTPPHRPMLSFSVHPVSPYLYCCWALRSASSS